MDEPRRFEEIPPQEEGSARIPEPNQTMLNSFGLGFAKSPNPDDDLCFLIIEEKSADSRIIVHRTMMATNEAQAMKFSDHIREVITGKPQGLEVADLQTMKEATRGQHQGREGSPGGSGGAQGQVPGQGGRPFGGNLP